jgi:hypothetical protein
MHSQSLTNYQHHHASTGDQPRHNGKRKRWVVALTTLL